MSGVQIDIGIFCIVNIWKKNYRIEEDIPISTAELMEIRDEDCMLANMQRCQTVDGRLGKGYNKMGASSCRHPQKRNGR
jgi:hypothetical protein